MQSGHDTATSDYSYTDILTDIYGMMSAASVNLQFPYLAGPSARVNEWMDYLATRGRLADICEVLSYCKQDPHFPKLVVTGATRHLRNKHELEVSFKC